MERGTGILKEHETVMGFVNLDWGSLVKGELSVGSAIAAVSVNCFSGGQEWVGVAQDV